MKMTERKIDKTPFALLAVFGFFAALGVTLGAHAVEQNANLADLQARLEAPQYQSLRRAHRSQIDGIRCINEVPARAKILHVAEITTSAYNDNTQLAASLRLNAENFIMQAQASEMFGAKYDGVYIVLAPQTQNKIFLGQTTVCEESDFQSSAFGQILGVLTLGLSKQRCTPEVFESWEFQNKSHLIVYGVQKPYYKQGLSKAAIGCSFVKNIDAPECQPGGRFAMDDVPPDVDLGILDDLTNLCY